MPQLETNSFTRKTADHVSHVLLQFRRTEEGLIWSPGWFLHKAVISPRMNKVGTMMHDLQTNHTEMRSNDWRSMSCMNPSSL